MKPFWLIFNVDSSVLLCPQQYCNIADIMDALHKVANVPAMSHKIADVSAMLHTIADLSETPPI